MGIKCVVVERKLYPDIATVVDSVHSIPESVDSIDSFAQSITEQRSAVMSKQFPEFKTAAFTYSIHNLN